MKLKKWELALVAALVVTVLWGASVERQQEVLAEKLIRLHVVGASDDTEDQQIKLEVRDAVLSELSTLLENAVDKSDAEKIIGDNLAMITDTANKALEACGADYTAAAGMDCELFPTRYYDTFSLPAGNYTSLRVILGSGEGHNWWCVVFPPICASAAVEDVEAAGLTSDEMELITSEDKSVVVKFRTLEIIAEIKNWFKG